MASKQSEANKRHYETFAAHAQSGEQLPPEEAAAWNDAEWTKLTAEPGSVDFLEVEVGGKPALWIVPKGAAHDVSLLYSRRRRAPITPTARRSPIRQGDRLPGARHQRLCLPGAALFRPAHQAVDAYRLPLIRASSLDIS